MCHARDFIKKWWDSAHLIYFPRPSPDTVSRWIYLERDVAVEVLRSVSATSHQLDTFSRFHVFILVGPHLQRASRTRDGQGESKADAVKTPPDVPHRTWPVAVRRAAPDSSPLSRARPPPPTRRRHRTHRIKNESDNAALRNLPRFPSSFFIPFSKNSK